MSSERVTAALAAYTAATAELLDRSLDESTHTELLDLLDDLETLTRRMPVLTHRLLARLQREASPTELGAKSWKAVLRIRLRISGRDAARRLAEAAELGPRTALNGETLPPVLAEVAAAQARGTIGAEHVTPIRKFLDKLPAWVDPTTREHAETSLTRVAEGHDPDVLDEAAARLALLIDQDGPEPDDTEPHRARTITLGPQQPDGTSTISGRIDAHLRAILETIHTKLAAPGMCNPDDDTPCTTGTPSQTQIDADTRTFGQRTHDALTAVGRSFLANGELGQHKGLPATIVVTTTLQDLQSARGSAVTAGGSVLPMAEVIRLATHAHHYLAIFDEHTHEPLYLGRTKRIAPAAHRIVLYARDRGCTFPGCTVPAHGTQVHHVNGWAKNNGQTNIDEEVLACGADNRLAEQGWTVTINNGIVEWTPPPHLDTGQPRTNHYHHPERLLPDPDENSGSP